MIFQDRTRNEWKVTVDESSVYIHTNEKLAVVPKLEVAAADVAEYYGMSDEDKEVFRRELGNRIGVPLWPLFAKVIFEPELHFMEKLGVFGRLNGREIQEEDRFDLFVPTPLSECQKENLDLEPSRHELEEISRQRAMHREEFKKEVICAICVPKSSLESDADEKLEVVQNRMQTCVVCYSPATAIGVYGGEEEDELIFHGICRNCTPMDDDDEQKVQAIADAIQKREKEGVIEDLFRKE
ncbi:MAG: hypothetical protein ACOC0U_03865 [Desulfovibrionales bacterium]